MKKAYIKLILVILAACGAFFIHVSYAKAECNYTVNFSVDPTSVPTNAQKIYFNTTVTVAGDMYLSTGKQAKCVDVVKNVYLMFYRNGNISLGDYQRLDVAEGSVTETRPYYLNNIFSSDGKTYKNGGYLTFPVKESFSVRVYEAIYNSSGQLKEGNNVTSSSNAIVTFTSAGTTSPSTGTPGAPSTGGGGGSGAGSGTGGSTGTGVGSTGSGSAGAGGTTGTKASDKLYNPLPTDNLTDMLLRIMRGFLAIMGAWAVAFIIIGGFKMVMAQGNEEAYGAAKKTIMWAVLGLVVAVLSFSIVAIVQNLLGVVVKK